MGINSQPHGIGSIITEINNEYQEQYNTTEKIFNLNSDGVTVGVPNSAGGGISPIYADANAELVKGTYQSSYPGSILNSFVGGTQEATQGQFLKEFSPDINSADITIEPSDGNIWVSDSNTDRYDKLSRDNSIIKTIQKPTPDVRKICKDPQDGTFWGFDRVDNILYQFDEGGNVISQASGQNGNDICKDWGTEYFWKVGGNTLTQIDKNGNSQQSFTGPNDATDAYDNTWSIEGVCVNPMNGNLWIPYEGELHEYDRAGNEIQAMPIDSRGGPIAVDPVDGTLWMQGEFDGQITHINPHPTPNRLFEYSGRTYCIPLQ